jgi:hypothetical protein
VANSPTLLLSFVAIILVPWVAYAIVEHTRVIDGLLVGRDGHDSGLWRPLTAEQGREGADASC